MKSTISSRAVRFVRAKAAQLAIRTLLAANDPRVIRAWRKGWDPLHYVRLLRWRDEGFEPRSVYDVGANHGVWSEMAEDVFHPEHLILFEPQSSLYPLIRERQQLRRMHHWRIMPIALGACNQEITLHITENAAASSLMSPVQSESLASGTKAVRGEQVLVRRLDDLVVTDGLPGPELVKIDVQGYEGCVLAGGAQTLRSAKALVVEASLKEIYVGQPLMAEILQTIGALGFTLNDVSETYRRWPAGDLLQVDLWFLRHDRH